MEFGSFRRKNVQMLATILATATYTAGFNPPGGVWQEDTAGHLVGDPMMRSTDHQRYLMFFYFNAAAFALSLMLVVVTLILGAYPDGSVNKVNRVAMLVMLLLATVSFMAAYGKGACRDKFGAVVFSVLVTMAVIFCLCQFRLSQIRGRGLFCYDGHSPDYFAELNEKAEHHREMISPLSMFALILSYVGGLSTPGGFWDAASSADDGGHRPGDSILQGKLVHLFYFFNTAQFVSSLQGAFLVTCPGVVVELAGFHLIIGQVSLIAAYTVGSSRGRHASVALICGLCAAVLAYSMMHVALRRCLSSFFKQTPPPDTWEDTTSRQGERVASLVQLLAGLAVSTTYQAGLYPPGGVWQNGDKAGDPILQTTNPGRYTAFYYCNSVAFVASLLAILLGQKRYMSKHKALQAAMILDLLALMVSYAIGSCRDQISSMYVLGIPAAAVLYVVVHVQYFTLDLDDGAGTGTRSTRSTCTDKADEAADRNCERFMLFAILVASITYQAGLTPPGGFLLKDDDDGQGQHRVGDPVLLYNYPRRYKAFFYCNSVSFMVSTVLLLFLVNPNMYRPAIRSHAVTLCSAVSFACLIGAFAAGSSQHMKASINLFILGGVVVLLFLPLLCTIVYSYCLPSSSTSTSKDNLDAASQAQTTTTTSTGSGTQTTPQPHVTKAGPLKKVYLMTLGILVAGVTYQAGLDPPGGSWQSGSHAGHPVMHDKRRNRYLAFLCGNSISFVASIYLIEILLLNMVLPHCNYLMKTVEPFVVAQYVGFLVAYAAGSSRQWKTSTHVGTIVVAVLAYVATHVLLTLCIQKKSAKQPIQNTPHQESQHPPNTSSA